ncbi:MAG: hypothetical protein M1823_001733 [Watsoniomyces obsoletus]|nr:MAG: hypothetical protein M1823_001733 [Watsoniomyces obsoletus]
MSSHQGPKVATVEDYDSDDEDGPPEGLREANTKSRRTPGPVATGPTPRVDAASDSGYSSHAPGTGPPSLSKDAPPAISTGAARTADRVRATPPSDPPTPSRGRPKLMPTRTLPVPPPTRSRRHTGAAEEPSRPIIVPAHHRCSCPTCQSQHPHANASPDDLRSPWTPTYPPPPPELLHHPAYNEAHWVRARQEPPATAVPESRPRMPRAQSSRPARPVSYHEGIAYSAAAYANHPREPPREPPRPVPMPVPMLRPVGMEMPFPPSSYPPPRYVPMPPPTQGQMPPPPTAPMYAPGAPYATARPMAQRYATERPPVRPISMYGAPVIEYDVGSPTATGPPPPMSRRMSNYGEHAAARMRAQEQEDYFRMPPPPPPGATRVAVPAPRPPPGPRPHSKELARSRSMPQGEDGMGVGPPPLPPDYHTRAKTSREALAPRLRRPSSHSVEVDPRYETELEAARRGHAHAEEKRRRRATYYAPEPGRDLERVGAGYMDDEVDAVAAGIDSLHVRGPPSRVGSDSSSQGKNGREGRPRPTSGIAVSKGGSDDSFTMRFTSGAAVNLDLTGGFEGRTVSFKPGHDGEQELSISSRKGYIDRVSGAYVEYARSGRRREIEAGPSSGPSRSSTHSRRSSRAAAFRHPHPPS